MKITIICPTCNHHNQDETFFNLRNGDEVTCDNCFIDLILYNDEWITYHEYRKNQQVEQIKEIIK